MKFITITFCMVFVKLGLFAQIKLTTITGKTNDTQTSYAYVTFNKDVYSTKVSNKKFKLTFPKVDAYAIGTIFFTRDSVSNEQAYQMLSNGIDDSRTIIVEDLHITISNVIRESIVAGGARNKELDEMYKSLDSNSYNSFFERYPDSPVSLTLLRTLISKARIAPYFKGELTLKVFYNKLSENLRKSKRGKELWNLIEPMYKTY